MTGYSHSLDSKAFWNRFLEHIFAVLFFAWLSAGFLARKEFRVDLTEAHLMEVQWEYRWKEDKKQHSARRP